jgi:hypothetical protein
MYYKEEIMMKFLKALEERKINRINKAIFKAHVKVFKLTALREKISRGQGL